MILYQILYKVRTNVHTQKYRSPFTKVLNMGVKMIHSKRLLMRTVKEEELETVYKCISDVNAKGEYWHLNLPSSQAFMQEYAKDGCWGADEGRMLILKNPFIDQPETEENTFVESNYIGEMIYFKGLDYQSGYEVGYEIFHQADFGKGYMSEALLLFCAFMFASRSINRIQVNLMHGNIGSKRVAEKCGFTYEGTMRQATFHRGQYHDLDLYSLLRNECPSLEVLLNEEKVIL